MVKNINISGNPFKLVLILSLLMLWTPTTFAHRSPLGCSGSALSINLYTSSPEVRIGDSVSFSIDIFNGTGAGLACDATNIQASIVTPDGQTHPVTLSRTALSSGQIDVYSSVVTYTARGQDIKTDGSLKATANVIGDIHQNDTNSQGGGSQGVNITIVVTPPPPPPPPPVVVTPPPPIGGGGGGGGGYTPVVLSPPVISLKKTPSVLTLPAIGGKVIYTYLVTNPGTTTLSNVTVVDDKCNPSVYVSGDANINQMLETSETWTYTCEVDLKQTTTNIATAEGHANNLTATATSSAIVTLSFPKLPNTGFAPEGGSLWDMIVNLFWFL
ncbi:MAG: hypothetical protein WCS89_02270 [Candidatus Paceibacterota bacterium]